MSSLPNHELPISPLSQTSVASDLVDDRVLQALLENQSLKEQIAQQTQLMHLLTHQLATPLTAFGGSVSLLAEPTLSAEHRQEFLDVVHQQVHRLRQLLQDLMALRNLETGVLETHPVSFCLPGLVEEVMVGFHEVKATYQFEPNLPQVWGDRWQLSQVLVNLLSNATKYSPNGAPVELGARCYSTGWLTVWVRDQGLGIPADDQPHLFERFYRVQHRDRHTIKGTGLGLSLCKLLVENQGGQLHFESVHGKGSCFSFTVPSVGSQS
jgi:signal transduction histidine kinase